MHVRTRFKVGDTLNGSSRTETWSAGSQSWVQVRHILSAQTPSREDMEDVVGNPNGVNPARSEKISRKGGIISGSSTAGSHTKYYFENYAPGAYSNNTLTHLSIDNVPSDVWCATEVASKTNPTNPSVNLPVAIAELRDIPRMMQKKHLRQKGNGVLEYNFGYAPMIQDLMALFNLVTTIESRLKTLEMLGKGKLSRTRTCFSGSKIQEDKTRRSVDYQAYCSVVAEGQRIETRLTKQATVSWKPNFPIGPLDPDEKWRLALRMALGLELTIIPTALYEYTSMSWLVDYFSNLGDLLSLTNNSVASLIGPVAVSTVQETTLSRPVHKVEGSGRNGISVSSFEMKKRTWTRSPVWPGLEVRMPILSIGQMSILNNLANSLGK